MRLISSSLPVRNQLHLDINGIFIFHFQNSLVLTSKEEEVSRTDTSPFRIKVSVPLYCPRSVVLMMT